MPIQPSDYEKIAADCERLIAEADDQDDVETLSGMVTLLRLRAGRLRSLGRGEGAQEHGAAKVR